MYPGQEPDRPSWRDPPMSRPVLLRALGALILIGGALAASTPAQAAPTTPTSVSFVRSCARPAAKAVMSCFALRRTDIAAHPASATLAVSGYGPSDLQRAYNLGAGGSGATVAIVDAYDDPNAESDLAT